MLRDCLASLAEHPPAVPMSVHVVDNYSADGTADMVEREFGEVKLTRASENLGFAAGTNLAIRAGSAPLVLALNPDTRVTAGALDALLTVARSEAGVGV